MVIPTDKSSKVAYETRDQYVSSMANQVTNDHVISLEERKDIENRLCGPNTDLAERD